MKYAENARLYVISNEYYTLCPIERSKSYHTKGQYQIFIVRFSSYFLFSSIVKTRNLWMVF